MTMPKKLKKTNVICCVPQCKTYGCQGIPIHRFPRCELEKQKWKLALRIEKPVTSSMRVCGLHFDRDCYIKSIFNVECPAKGRKLKRNICPSKNLPDVSFKAVKKKNRDEKKCCYVPGCRKDEEDGVSLHLFPRATEFISVKDGSSKKPNKVNRKTRWQEILKIKNQIPEWAVICSNHFQPQDFLPVTTTLDGKKVYRLKKIAVPNRNLPEASRRHRKILASPETFRLNLASHILNESTIESENNLNDESPLLLLLRAADEVNKDSTTLQSPPKKKIVQTSPQRLPRNVQTSPQRLPRNVQTSPQRLPRNENADVGASPARSEPIVTRKPQSTIRLLRAPPIFFEGRRCIKL